MVLLSGATASEVKQYEGERLHRALGHPGNSALVTLVKTLEGHVEDTSVTPETVKQLGACEQCLAAWQADKKPISRLWASYRLEIGYCLVSFLSHKNDAFSHMKKVHKFVERQTGNNTKCSGLTEVNGLAERMHLTIFNKVRAMLVDSGIDKQHWAEAAGTAAYVYNRTASSATPRGKTPYECYWGKKPDISNLRPFGDVAMVMTMPRYARDGKMGPVSVKSRLMGYSECSKAWRVLLPSGLVSESRDVVFPADKFTAGKLLAQHGNSPTTLPATSSPPPPPQHEHD
ncbi:hypothetical protein CEUSTIGMA_g9165.t1 [Chlamydomonas eustigma]|uniref:Retroviral polymerase SH3-like domain-containing protein n=1 Tax=Chlamydomonas eustigma TaxID=1157962 RepID=A0A250XF81_9CHLO|nr:hypothetical protein CEUSTIGMA_g9165.t1 [Chlamydomonas eustigma]|eukprot:GAX81737.1 hypothetical protein CEUSTIGMA_g9165.t1 [Chlamydomonas eustigma]